MNNHPVGIAHKLVSIVLLFSLLAGQFFAVYADPDLANQVEILPASTTKEPQDAIFFRTRVLLRQSGDLARLEEMQTVVLEANDDSALLLVTAVQLETLARLGFRPNSTDELESLTIAHAEERSWLYAGLESLFEEADAIQFNLNANNLNMNNADTEFMAILAQINAEQKAALTTLTSIDDDGDGLTNTEELWWCTDSQNPNSDGDAQGDTDGQEITALLDFTLPRSVRWGYGPPFGPPNAWPDFNGQDGNPNTPACNDGDFDTIPDYAEAYMVGSRTPYESTDGDKFDDGQELFGTTYCPGGVTSCGYGSYPRQEYWNYIQANMPAWVESPGDNLFVAAFPVPEVSVVPGSWTVERVTTITTEQGEMTEATNSYATSIAQGQSTGIENTTTWNEWEEVSESVETPLNTGQSLRSPESVGRRVWGAAQLIGGTAIAVVPAVACAAGTAASLGIGAIPCAGIIAGAATIGGGIAGQGWADLTSPDEVQQQIEVNNLNSNMIINDVSATASAQASITLNQNFDTQGIVNSLSGVQYAINQQGELLARGLYDISYAISQPRLTETRTNGRSWGGAQTTTQEEYEEHTITQGEQFTTGENWSTAWAVNSSHAADLTFDFTIENTGTEYARELTGLIFNIYLGDDPNPLISYPGWEKFPNGTIENIFPADAPLTFSSDPIPLTLDQMRRIDLGERLTVVLEDYSYGADELFYQNAVNGGFTVFIEDGVADGDESVDSYVIPTWGTESVQDVLTRYFPASVDVEGNLNALWTPEFNGINPPTWQEHFLSDIAWWNIYQTCTADCATVGSTPLHEQPVQASGAILFRFNRDSDRDGYQDRVELRYGTDKDDPASHPQPELLAGYVTTRDGDTVTAYLKLENSGSFDAYGIDAVMYAPDDTVTIGNNTVGGNGRVRPGATVAVGSLILQPDLTNWSNSTAKPYVAGNFTGGADKTITLTVSAPGVVGQSSTAMTWSDGLGGSGAIDLGSSYHAPLPIPVTEGIEVGFDTGTLGAGNQFAVTALTPRDTFTYTIESEPYTPPVVVVSYSDPQGSHRFVTPVEIADLQADLAPYSGEMLENVKLDIVTTGPVDPTGNNMTNFVINSPHAQAIEDAHLYLNFVSEGALVAEIPFTRTIEAGPTVISANWSTAVFSQTYNSEADNLLIAFWTDSQGNIIDSAARPLSSFQEDPIATFATDEADLIWDFGTARQGTLMQREFYLGSVGFRDLQAYIGEASGITLEGPIGTLLPADMGVYTMTINTEYLPVGVFTQTIPIRTSDPTNPTRTIFIQGEIQPFTQDDTQSATIRPLDMMVTITGTYTSGEWVTYTHTLGPTPQTLHPIKVYSQDYTTLWGVGKNATDFDQSTASANIFGDGSDGDLTVPASQTQYTDNIRQAVAANANSGQNQISVVNGVSFAVGDEILIIQMQGVGAGNHEFAIVGAINGNALTLQDFLINTYTAGGNSKAQVLRVPHYHHVTVENSGVLTAHAWNGSTGGIVAFRASGEVRLQDGVIDVAGKGFTGGVTSSSNHAEQGDSATGNGINATSQNGTGGGGGALGNGAAAGGGGGGGNGSLGVAGQPGARGGGSGGATGGSPELTSIIFGGAGGGGGYRSSTGGGTGGASGGIIFVAAHTLTLNGDARVTAAGNVGGNRLAGDDSAGGGGGGAGGSILIQVANGTLGTSIITATGGNGGLGRPGSNNDGGAAGIGRVRIEYCESLTGTTNPPASTQQLDCYIVEQVESALYNQTRLSLPEAVSGTISYAMQYGRQYTFSLPGEQTQIIRLPKQLYTDASLDLLLGNTDTSSGLLDLGLDIGNNGTLDWLYNDNATFPTAFALTDLVSALNAYLVSRTDVAWGEDIDVPVRLSSNRQADIVLTNLALILQFNQPDEMMLNAVDLRADRPLDWTVVVTGTHNMGEWISFTHTMGPNTQTLHPVRVYSQDYATLWGVGKYAESFGEDTVSYEIFGDGRNGDLVVQSGQTVTINSTRVNVSASGMSAEPANSNGFAAGDIVLFSQTQGTENIGRWELAEISSINSTTSWTLTNPLIYSYNNTTGRAQVIKVPQYQDVIVHDNGVLTAPSWDGNTGGIIVFLANGVVEINQTGTLTAQGIGYRSAAYYYRGTGIQQFQGEGHTGIGAPSSSRNASGGGGGKNETGHDAYDIKSAGGGGHATAGQSSGLGYGQGGAAYGSNDLSTSLTFGGAGGIPGGDWRESGAYAKENPLAGNGGGIIVFYGRSVQVAGTITANGENGYPWSQYQWSDRAGGAGGSIYITAYTANLGTNRLQAIGGTPLVGRDDQAGSGGLGRIRIDYCSSMSGSTNPQANSHNLNCFITEQIELSPDNQAQFNLLESFTNGRSYQIQYGRRYVFSTADQQTDFLRLTRQVYGSASIETLISNTGVAFGTRGFCLDIGDDGTCDYTQTESVNFPADINVDNFTTALNNYLFAHEEVAWGDHIDVPVRVQVDGQADVILTNLALTPVGAKTRYLRLPAQTYDEIYLELLFEQQGVPNGALSFTVDVGVDGTIDWVYAGNPTFPTIIGSNDLSAAFNAYLFGRSGEVDVPIRIVPSPYLDTALYDFQAVPNNQPDATLTTTDISFVPDIPTESDVITATAVLHNNGAQDSNGVTVAFFATLADGNEWYIGSDFVSNISAGSTATASIPWNTSGFTDTIPVRVQIDPYNRLGELLETNNEATRNVAVLTRPDLQVSSWPLSDPEPVTDETITIALNLHNTGQTIANNANYVLYHGHPESGGVLLESVEGNPITGGGNGTVTFSWTPTEPGLHRLFIRLDEDDVVNEYDEGNNLVWQDIYVGFDGPLLLDSGELAMDPSYSSELGYGYLNGQGSTFCGLSEFETQRTDPSGQIQYRFDHLLPGHFYHLDLALFECDDLDRVEVVTVDGISVTGQINLGDSEIHKLSLLLDPALYADRSIIVSVEELLGNGAVISAINLYDIDYRYADSGGSTDVGYTIGNTYGWLDGVEQTIWGILPYQSRRIDLADSDPTDDPDNELRYRFDNLDPEKRYTVYLNAYQNVSGVIQQQIYIDNILTGSSLNLNGPQVVTTTVEIPPETYGSDGSIIIKIRRTNASAGAFVNEIALEEKTLLTEPVISQVQVSNLSDSSATISWLTDTAVNGTVHYGTSPTLGALANDDRGNIASQTHYATLSGLTANTTYFFYVQSDDSIENNSGSFYQFTTGPALNPPAPDTIFGQVYEPDGVTPANGALVTVQLRDNDGQGSGGSANLLSALVDSDYWFLNLSNARTTGGQQLFVYSAVGDQVEIIATNGDGCSASQIINTDNDAPAPTLTLNCATQVVHTLNPGWTLLAPNLNTNPATLAESALDEIVDQGGNVTEVDRWLNGGWNAHLHNLPFNNYPLELGRGYFFRATVGSVWERTGLPPTSPVPLTLGIGWNLIGLPRFSAPLSAEQLLDGITAQGGNCTEIDRWLNGGWNAHLHNLPFNDFALMNNQGYFIRCTTSSTYAPPVSGLTQSSPEWAVSLPNLYLSPTITPDFEWVEISNRRDVAVSIIWQTDTPSVGYVAFGQEGRLDKLVMDDRGRDYVSRVHMATLTGLLPETTYQFQVYAGETASAIQSVTTMATGNIPMPLAAYGQVLDANAMPAVGTLVKAWLEGSQGSQSEEMSIQVDGWGYWWLSLPLENCLAQTLHIQIIGPLGHEETLSQPACDVQPVPAISLPYQQEYYLYLPIVEQ
jgi:hypothetical protein